MSKLIGYDYGSSYNTFQTTTTATTTNTTLTTMGSLIVPDNTFQVGQAVRCTAGFDKVNNNNGYDIRFYWNTTPDLSGSPVLFGVVSATTTTASYYGFQRNIIINTNSGSNNAFCYSVSTTTLITDLNPIAAAISTVTIDFTTTGYVVFAARVLSSSDTMNFRWGKLSNG